MALLQIHAPSISSHTLSSVFSSHPSPLHTSISSSSSSFSSSSSSSSSSKTHQVKSFFSNTTTLLPSTKNTPFSLSTQPRKLLCRPPRGKYVREDYLVKKLSAQEVQDLVKGERTVPLVIDFYATWCGPCILMAQELEMLAVEYESNVMIVKVDTDNEYEFARDMQVRGLPSVFFISPDPNKDAIRTEGLIPIQMMRDIIDNEM